jgi:hypothetical protein
VNKLTNNYFSILRDYFGKAYKLASKKKFDFNSTTKILSDLYDPVVVKPMLMTLGEELKGLNWSAQEVENENMTGLKASYLGSQFSFTQHVSSTSDFLRKTALYAETVILPDNVLGHLKYSKYVGDPPLDLFFVIGHSAIELLALEHLFTSDTDHPICSLAAPLDLYDKSKSRDKMLNEYKKETHLSYVSDLFGRDFPTYDDFLKYLSSKKTLEKMYSSVKKPERLLNPGGDPLTLRQIKNIKIDFETIHGKIAPPEFVFNFAVTDQCNYVIDELHKKGKHRSALATDMNGFWSTLTWLINNDNKMIFEKTNTSRLSKDELIINALQQDDLNWLGAVPINKLLALRANGELDDLRELFSENVEAIMNASDDEFFEVGQTVKYNIEQAMKQHSKEVRTLDEKYKQLYKIGSIGLASMVVTGTMAFISSVYQPLSYASSISSSVVGGLSGFQTAKEYLSLRNQQKELKAKPVAILFNARPNRDNNTSKPN